MGILRHRRWVAAGWLIVVVGAIAVTPRVAGRLSHDFSLRGQASSVANADIVRTYGNGGPLAPLIPVITLPAGPPVTDPATGRAIGTALDQIAALNHLRNASYFDTGDRRFLVGAARDGRPDAGRVTYALAFAPSHDGQLPGGLSARVRADLTARLDRVRPGTTVVMSGAPLLSSAGGGGVGLLAETILGGAAALVVLAFLFGSLVAVLPLVVAAVSVLTSFLLLYLLTMITQVNFVAQFLVALIGLGVAIDYSLLIVTRWREERAAGLDNPAAVAAALARAGRTVAFSGVTVAVSLAALVFLPVPFLRSLGYAGLFIPLVSIAVALTLLPVLLVTVGPRLDRRAFHRRAGAGGRGWQRWARLVVRHRFGAALLALLILVPLAVAAGGLRLGDASATSYTGSPPAAAVATLVRGGAPAGSLTPVETLVPSAAAAPVAARLRVVPGVADVLAPSGPAWQRSGTRLLEVIPAAATTGPRGAATVRAVRRAVAGTPGVRVGGVGPAQVDFVHAVYGRFPLVIGLIAAVSFVLLVAALRSVVLPLKALALNALSVLAAYGVLVLVWQRGYGSRLIWGIPATGAITEWIPLMVFAFLFGLSMDYEVFLLSRMRESYAAFGSTDAAAVDGLARTGRLITGAAIVLFLGFAAMAGSPPVFLKVFATGLAAGILLDATVVRCLLVPALVAIFGRANWWLPGRPGRRAELDRAEGSDQPDRSDYGLTPEIVVRTSWPR